jgi:hypothetical protein
MGRPRYEDSFSAHRDTHRELVREGGRDATIITKLLGLVKLYPPLFRYIAHTRRFCDIHGILPDAPANAVK